jgi:uncharacterized protein (TIGR00290 family)
MNEENKTIVAWSGGKDSALALYELQQTRTVEIVALLTTVTEEDERIGMHGIRRSLLQKQSESLGYPLEEVRIPSVCPNDIYERRLQSALKKYQQEGVSTIAFGDLFLEDIRNYREKHMKAIGMNPLFPLWLKDTTALAFQCVGRGFRAIVSCVDTQQLPAAFSGREYDDDFLRNLPDGADPCGENGEFHTFVYDGPNFRTVVPVEIGEKTLKKGRFQYCDLK